MGNYSAAQRRANVRLAGGRPSRRHDPHGFVATVRRVHGRTTARRPTMQRP
jgi:hypothetical protein